MVAMGTSKQKQRLRAWPVLAVLCLINLKPNHPNSGQRYRRWNATDFPKGGMSNCTLGFPTPLACEYKDHSATFVIALQQHHHRSKFVALLVSCNQTEGNIKTLR
jgi:hypothetical protein